MSLILDALKQADRDRRIGQPPDVTTVLHMKNEPSPRHRIWLWLGMIVLALGAFFALVYRPAPPAPTIGKSVEHSTAEMPKKSASKADAADPAPAPKAVKKKEGSHQRLDSPVSPPQPPSPGNRINGNPQPSSFVANVPSPVAVSEIPIDAPSSEPVPARVMTPSESKEIPPEERKKPATATDKVKPVTRSEDLPLVGQLPPEIRGPLQELEISAHVFNNDPSRRFVFIDQHSYHEGDRIGDNGLILKEILPDGIVIDYGEGRARLPVKRPRLW